MTVVFQCVLLGELDPNGVGPSHFFMSVDFQLSTIIAFRTDRSVSFFFFFENSMNRTLKEVC